MDYAEASYFDGFHYQHIADWLEHLRQERMRIQHIQLSREKRFNNPYRR